MTFRDLHEKIFQDLFVAHKCVIITYWHHEYKSTELQVICKQSEQKMISNWAYKKRVIFKEIFPELPSTGNVKKKILDFPEGVGTLLNYCWVEFTTGFHSSLASVRSFRSQLFAASCPTPLPQYPTTQIQKRKIWTKVWRSVFLTHRIHSWTERKIAKKPCPAPRLTSK